MKKNFVFFFVFGYLIFAIPIWVQAQLSHKAFADIESDYMHPDVLFRMGALYNYKLHNSVIEGGTCFSFGIDNYAYQTFYGGFDQTFLIKQKPVNAKVFYIHNLISQNIKEMQFGVILSTQFNKFKMDLGNNTRIYAMTRYGKAYYEDLGITPHRLIEARNLVYKFTYFLKENDSRWNLSFSLLNYDNFFIQQETNPMVSTSFTYNLTDDFCLFTDLWYKSAGFANIRVNYFGIIARTGFVWRMKI